MKWAAWFMSIVVVVWRARQTSSVGSISWKFWDVLYGHLLDRRTITFTKQSNARDV